MQQKHVFRRDFFPLFVFGHFFCPFLTFPKYFQSKKPDIFSYAPYRHNMYQTCLKTTKYIIYIHADNRRKRALPIYPIKCA
jgi:hypothetical protein